MKFSESSHNVISVPKYESCFVYFLIKDGEVVYVGQTQQGIARPLSHRDKDFDEIKILYCKPDELDLLEDTFIQKYKPAYNKQSNYVIRWSLLRVRNHIRKETGREDYTVPKLKRLLKRLNIRTEKDYYNGRETITFDEYKIVTAYLIRNGEYAD